jgi:hypothetical protein
MDRLLSLIRHNVYATYTVLIAGIMITACNTNLPVSPTITFTPPTAISTNTSITILLPSNTPAPTEITCPPYPLVEDLPLPNNVEEFIGRYVQIPGRIEGIQLHWYSPMGPDGSDFNDEYIVSDPAMDEKNMLWLEKRICATLSRPSYYRIVDVVELPTMTDDEITNLTTCLINGSLSPRIIGVGKINNGSGKFSEPRYAWQINISNEAIVPVETGNVQCDFDMSYPQP